MELIFFSLDEISDGSNRRLLVGQQILELGQFAGPSERRDNNAGGNRRGAPNAAGQPQVARKAVNKVVHSEAKSEGAPDPRWARELSKLKDLLAN